MVCLYTQIALETGSFTVLEHKTKYLFACQNIVVYLFQSSFTVTQVTQMSMLQFI